MLLPRILVKGDGPRASGVTSWAAECCSVPSGTDGAAGPARARTAHGGGGDLRGSEREHRAGRAQAEGERASAPPSLDPPLCAHRVWRGGAAGAGSAGGPRGLARQHAGLTGDPELPAQRGARAVKAPAQGILQSAKRVRGDIFSRAAEARAHAGSSPRGSDPAWRRRASRRCCGSAQGSSLCCSFRSPSGGVRSLWGCGRQGGIERSVAHAGATVLSERVCRAARSGPCPTCPGGRRGRARGR